MRISPFYHAKNESAENFLQNGPIRIEFGRGPPRDPKIRKWRLTRRFQTKLSLAEDENSFQQKGFF